PPGHHLVGVLAPWPTLLGRLDTLAVNDRHAGAGLPTGLAADLVAQGIVEPLPGAVVAPLAEVVVAGTPGGKVLGHHPPGAAAPDDVQDAVKDLPQVHRAGSPAGLGRREQPLELLPLVAGEIGGVALGFGPGLLGFHVEF